MISPPTRMTAKPAQGRVVVADGNSMEAESCFDTVLLEPNGLDLVMELAHDLRSPLTSILFLAETLRNGQSGKVTELQHRQLGIIYDAVLGLISVASDAIELAQGEDRLVDNAKSIFSVSEILASVADIVGPIAEERKLALRLLPPPLDRRLGYPVALSRALLNLTTNALKFTERGGVEILTRQLGSGRIEFSVRDSGQGMTPEVVATLYQPFRRARDREGFYFSGSGLGLAIARKLVHAMDGTLELETHPGCGTRFFFELNLPVAGPA